MREIETDRDRYRQKGTGGKKEREKAMQREAKRESESERDSGQESVIKNRESVWWREKESMCIFVVWEKITE